MSALDQLYSAIEKAGLIKPGKPSLMRRIGFLLSTGSNERNYKIGRYLEGRKAGKGYGPKGKRRARTGTYTGVYATGVNKSELSMSALDDLDQAIEKAHAKITARGNRVKKSDEPTALDQLDEAIEKARGLIRGGSKRMARVANRHADKKYEGKGRADTPKGYSRASKLQQYTSLRASGWKSVRAGSPWSRDTVTPRRSK